MWLEKVKFSDFAKMFGGLVRTAVKARRAIVPVTRASVRHSGGGGDWIYRSVPEVDPRDTKMAVGIMTLAWWWFFYHMMTEYEHVTGHFLRPDGTKWTDAELGVPPDDE